MTNPRKSRFNRIGDPNTLSVLCREIVEGEKPGLFADAGDYLFWVSSPEGQDTSQPAGPTPVQGPRPGTDSPEQPVIDVLRELRAEDLFARLGKLFEIQEFNYLFRNLDAWIRSRLRSTQLKKGKSPQMFQRFMIRAGFDPQQAHRVCGYGLTAGSW